MDNQFSLLGLSDLVVKSLESAGIGSIQALSKYTKQQLLDLSGIGATSADRILAAIDRWFEESLELRTTVTNTNSDPIVEELLEHCTWAKDVFGQLGGQRGMFLAGQMRLKIEAARSQLGDHE